MALLIKNGNKDFYKDLKRKCIPLIFSRKILKISSDFMIKTKMALYNKQTLKMFLHN